ncbi:MULTISPECIES: amidohydrolase family protein [Metallosphaera]|uniref:Amidohydrolase-related domain-containing protein n=1 Tax=Metallosphaera prunae TaxID=47304 RepID=A0A4D8S126_METPR|nr:MULTISPECIES: amidohydrolase family protein [Metallosphaera]QCO29129.1 hypothetical protein DFR88_00380 [Metallosphaera prunae]BBL47286.1 amidohydrolase 2 [Metallosphaera sedula]
MQLVIDVHSHFYPKSYVEALNRRGFLRNVDSRLMISWGKRSSPVTTALTDINQKIENLKKLPYSFYSILSMSAPWTYILPKEEEVKVVKESNDQLAEIVRKYPDNFGGLATLPLNDIEASINEAERAIRDLGLHGFVVGTGVGDKTIADPEFKPVFKKISELSVPVFIHPGTMPLDRVLNEGAFAIFTSFVFETTYVATKLSLDGVLKEYGLKIIIPHGGGFIPYQLARFDMAHEVYKLGVTNPSGDLKKNVYYDTVVYSRETLEFLEKIMGIDKVVYGTDHPFPVSFPDLFLKLIQEVNPKDEDREKILTKNAKELFKLKNL